MQSIRHQRVVSHVAHLSLALFLSLSFAPLLFVRTGAWEHVCKASVSVSCNGLVHMIEMSRQLPDHVAAIFIPHAQPHEGDAAGTVKVGWALEQQVWVLRAKDVE